jgi:chromosome segregation ATPase
MPREIKIVQQIPATSEPTAPATQQAQREARQSNDLILLVSTLAAQLHQTREELDEAHELLHLMREKLKQLESLEGILHETQQKLEHSQAAAQQFQAEKQWLESKHQALRQTAQQLQNELKRVTTQQHQTQDLTLN